jgi:phenylalanyl-tRNA synthetase beta chain
MVTLDTKYSRLLRYIGKPLDDQTLQETLTNLGIEVKLWEPENDRIKLEYEPGRPDLYSSTIGTARAIRYYLELDSPEATRYTLASQHTEYKVVVSQEALEFRPYTAWAVAEGITVDDDLLEELKIEQELLANNLGRKRRKFSIGLYPADRITWPVRLEMRYPKEIVFRPLDFSSELTAKEILEFHPKGKQYRELLSGLLKYPVFVDSEDHILSLLPIVNSEDWGKVTPGTRKLAIEVTGTNAYYVNKALEILACNLIDLGAKIYPVKIEYPHKVIQTPSMRYGEIEVSKQEIEQLLGIELTHKDILRYLARMGLLGNTLDSDRILVRYPPYRLDILDTRDIIEDVAIAYGYENFEPTLPKMFTIGDKTLKSKVQQRVRELLVGLGFNEVMTFALTNLDDQYTKMLLEIPSWAPVIENAVEKYLNTVRTWILPELLKFLYANKSKEYPIKIFDADDVVEPDSDTETGYKNAFHVAIAISDSEVTYTNIRQVVEYLLDRLGIQYSLEESQHPSFIEGRQAKILVNDKEIGVMGELHPQVLENFRLEKPVAAAELDFSKIFGI